MANISVANINEIRYDPRGRKLRTGEYYEERTGRYRYCYFDSFGNRKTVYSWTLTRNDRIPEGKRQKPGESLREKEQLVQTEIQNGLDATGGNQTVYTLMKRYITLKWKDVRDSTRKGYNTQLNFMKKQSFGRRRIKTITSTEAEEWFMDLHEKHGKNYSTLHTLRGILRPAFAMAQKNRWVLDNPFDFPLNKKRYGGQKMRDALSKKDMKRFLDFVRTDRHFSRYFNGFYLLFHTGLRISEFCGLTMDDLDFENHIIHVRRQLIRIYDEKSKKGIFRIEETKTQNGNRIVPMFADVEQVLKDVLKNRPQLPKEKDPIVWNEDHSQSATGFLWFDKNQNLEVAQHWQNHFRWALGKFNKTFKDELPDITPHVCRHTFCSMCVSGGMAPKTLQTIMGHSGIEITLNVYTHLETGDILKQFGSLKNNHNYDFYSLSSAPALMASEEDDEEETSVPDFSEEPDDDD